MIVSAGRLEDIPIGRAVVVEAESRQVAVFNVEGRLYALDNRCLHNGGPIGEGWVKDGTRARREPSSRGRLAGVRPPTQLAL